MKTTLMSLLIWLPVLVFDRLLRLFATTTIPQRTGVWYPETQGLYVDNIQHYKIMELGTTFPLIDQHPRVVLTLALLGFVLIVTATLWRTQDKRLVWAFTPLLVGFTSNLFDLWMWNSATDPLVYVVGNDGMAFNIADLCIVIGVVAFFISFVRVWITMRNEVTNWRMLFVGTTKAEAELFFN